MEVLEREQVDWKAYEQELAHETAFDASRRHLSEVDHINRYRSPITGVPAPEVLKGVRENLITGAKEAAMPYAVSTTYQECVNGSYMWLDQTPEQVAASGYIFHKHPAAIKRVDVEIDEAYDTSHNMRPGLIKAFISPRMSRADASLEDAKNEHLGMDDMLRIHMIDQNEDGTINGKYMQSILIRDIPLSAWVNMLADPNNIFGKSITVRDEASALSVMEVHRELELPEASLPNGVLSLVEAVLPYADAESQKSIRNQLNLFKCDQKDLHQKAESIADRWLEFEVELADSLASGYATPIITEFLRSLSDEWSIEFVAKILENTEDDGRIHMDRAFAVDIERSKRNTLWVKAGVATGNQAILKQMTKQEAAAIMYSEAQIYAMVAAGANQEQIRLQDGQGNKVVAGANVKAGAGCPGEDQGVFGGSEKGLDEKDPTESADGEWHGGKKFYNTKCRSCKEVKFEVGACHICENCVHNPAKMQAAYNAENGSPKPERTSIIDRLVELLQSKEEAPKAQTSVAVGRSALAE